MNKTDKLEVKFHDRRVGLLSLTPDNRLNVFEYDKSWIADEFSISPLELPLKPGVFVAKPQPFNGNFGIFEDSLPDGYGRYLLHKALLRNGINDSDLSSLDRLALVGGNGMGALIYSSAISLEYEETIPDFDKLQEIALFYVLKDFDSNTWKWRLAPAYDLTLCTEGYNGEHATSVNGTGHPRLSDFMAVGKKIRLSEDRCRQIIDEVRSGCLELTRYEIRE